MSGSVPAIVLNTCPVLLPVNLTAGRDEGNTSTLHGNIQRHRVTHLLSLPSPLEQVDGSGPSREAEPMEYMQREREEEI